VIWRGGSSVNDLARQADQTNTIASKAGLICFTKAHLVDQRWQIPGLS
jgi:hypothetical protein